MCNVYAGDDLALAAARRVGLPIGNLTSQWFGGIYLNEFDHWVKETLRCPGYVRYVDDFLLFADDKAELAGWREMISAKLGGYRLRLNDQKSRAYPVQCGITFLGQRVWPWRRRLCRQNVASARRRLRWNVQQFKRQEMSQAALECRWNSWRGHASAAGAVNLINLMRKELRHDLGTTGT